MRIIHKEERGFSLIEMLMVIGIIAVVSAALYSFYITYLRTSYHHDQLLEVQQNMRMAMDSISRDLMMAGTLVPSGTTPLQGPSAGYATLGIYSSSVAINTASADRVFARITHGNRTGVASFNNLTTSVDPGSILGFNVGDVVRIVRPAFNCNPGSTSTSSNEPLRCQYALGDYTTMVVAASPASGVMSLKRANSANFDSGISLNQGDVIAKKGGYASSPTSPASPDSVNYYLSTGNGCPTGQSCLFRSVNGALGDLVAGYMKSIKFTYTPNPGPATGQNPFVSVTVDLIGTTTKPSGASQQLATREMKTLIKLRQ
jgi:prepilin-type N-terminal cleavage/methylation domain-containing protein